MSTQTELLPVYLAVGEDQLKREAVVARIQKRIAAMGDIDFNAETFDGGDAPGDEIIAACSTLPFASDKRLVIVKNVEKLKKASQDDLVAYLGDPTPTTVLVLLAAKLAKNTRLYKAIAAFGKTSIIACDEKTARELPTQVRDMAVSKGVTLTSDAATALLGAVGSSTIRLNTELDKIIAYIGSEQKQITIEDVNHVVATTAEIKPWALQDSFSKRDVFLTATLIDRLYATGQSPHGLLALVLSRLRELISVVALLERGYTQATIASQMRWPDWKARNAVGWARSWSAKELREALSSAADVEQKMKSGYDADMTFQIWLLGVTAR